MSNLNVSSTESNTTMTNLDKILTMKPQLTTDDSKISTIVQVLFNAGLSTTDSLVVASALLDTQEYIEYGYARWHKKMDKAIRGTVLQEGDVPREMQYDAVALDWLQALERADLIVTDGEEVEAGEYLLSLDKVKLPHYPTLATAKIVKMNQSVFKGDSLLQGADAVFDEASWVVRRKQTRTKTSKCFDDAIHNLEQTVFNVDEFMMQVAEKVKEQVSHDLTNVKGNEVFERYVYDGCKVLIAEGNVARISEFFGDTRGRIYQAACHGPNGQSSDFARAMMDLHGVGMHYNCVKALQIIDAEIEDMHSFKDLDAELAKVTSASQFIIGELLAGQASLCKKPWSLMKAVNIRRAIVRHMKAPEQFAKPYIGMAFGLDAKCSGPQLGALMTNDQRIAAACGFTLEQLDDAYKLATDACITAGFGNIPRSVIKKPYMGIFYGQSYQAFILPSEKDMAVDSFRHLIEIISNGPMKSMEKNAKRFHAAIETSFGKMEYLRVGIKAAHACKDENGGLMFMTKQATSHLMPDGFNVSMNYKTKLNLHGELVTFDTELPDVTVFGAAKAHTFKKITFRTKKDSLSDYMRTGFVNLIQATDALLARLIINHLAQDEGAQHIIAVHDCFRVNINDMIDGKLHRAIQSAYMTIFGSECNEKRGYMTQGTDIVGLYFEGVERARTTPILKKMSQFDVDGDRDLDGVGKHTFAQLVGQLENKLDNTGKSYFFAK